MGFKSDTHEDESLFCNRLWKLMQGKNLTTAEELAKALFGEGIVTVTNRVKDYDGSITIRSMSRRIQDHLNMESAEKLPGRYVMAYCEYFQCSADYLFGRTKIISRNQDVSHFCECTGLSEKAVKRLIEEFPLDIKMDLVGFWSNVLSSNVFYGVPFEFHRMCYELGQYCTTQNMIKIINNTSKQMDNSDSYVKAINLVMGEEYQKRGEPHIGAYYMHLQKILSNLTAYLETWAEEYVKNNQKKIDEFFYDKLHEEHEIKHESFFRHIEEGADEL